MAFSYSFADATYTEANFTSVAYADETTGFPGALRDIVAHVAAAFRQNVVGSISTGTGTKSGTIYRNAPFFVGQNVVLESASGSDTMTGTVSAYTASTGAISFNITSVTGSGTNSDWTVKPTQGVSSVGITGLTAATSYAASDTVAMSVGGADRQVAMVNFCTSLGANFTSATIQAAKVQVDDSSFHLDITSSNPTLTLDTGDTLVYDRASNFFQWNIGSTERLRLDSNGRLTQGGAAQTINSVTASSGQYGTTGATATRALGRWSADANPSVSQFAKSRAASVGSFSAVQSGDGLHNLDFLGDDGAAFAVAARIAPAVDGSVSSGVVPGRIVFLAANTSGTLAERMRVSSTAIHLVSASTTASAANAFIDSGSSPANSILRSTSSLAYKRDVEPLDASLAERFVREARPIWYRSKASADNPAWSWYGLGAEEVAEIDPRMVQWGRREEGGPLVPDGVAYDRIPVLLLPIVRRLMDRVSALEVAR